jgi:hypothetical protein
MWPFDFILFYFYLFISLSSMDCSPKQSGEGFSDSFDSSLQRQSANSRRRNSSSCQPTSMAAFALLFCESLAAAA